MDRVPAMRVADEARSPATVGAAVIPTFGSPVLALPAHAREAVLEAASHAHERNTRGAPGLRHAIAAHLWSWYRVAADPATELLITHGAMHGLGVAFRALFRAGDEIVVPAPTFFYDVPIRQTGASPVYVVSVAAQRWRWELADLERALTSRTRAVVVCNPTNPTGYVPSLDEVGALVEWAAMRELTVIADEAYGRFVYDGGAYTPQMRFRDRHPNLVTVTSLSKNYGFSNWRVGYVHAAAPVLDRIHAQFEWDALDVGAVPQAAAQAVIEGPQAWLEGVLASYEPNRDRLQAGLEASGLAAVRPAGAPFTFVDFSVTGLAGRALESELLARGVPAVAGDGFKGPPTHARIMFGGTPSAIDRVVAALGDLGAGSIHAADQVQAV